MTTTTLPSIRACSRKNRVYVFREFLLETYGSDYLSQGDVVLDIAGGKGDLSWLLSNADGYRSIVVDPRPTQHQHVLRSIDYLRKHPDEAALRAIRNQPTHQPLATLLPELPTDEFQTPRHFPIWVDENLVQAVQAAQKGNQVEWELYWARAMAAFIDNNTDLSPAPPQNSSVTDPKEAWDLIQKCKLIAAFHPDQATDFCFELAELLNIPFCVVPCCVFPAQFPHRKLIDGTRVRDYSGLLSYLTQKYPNAQKAQLAFHETAKARNLVLFSVLPLQQERQNPKRNYAEHEDSPASLLTLSHCVPTSDTTNR
ncbi:hypothetical protein FisN_1Hu352 [Fistulifera solaris]|uniref:Methyltransferase domain-containing protein n=1 Tax=Fistulifera solaris TaxID=1519565 RepID=A0A1Z5JAM9_FISSO|nr:hypothetical protein FisN_1Hu352 [Fistulifera solaris]|eukprot:GAX10811.1 hypothetical protein FisN_1Hu352 [Fistulifera solaris]